MNSESAWLHIERMLAVDARLPEMRFRRPLGEHSLVMLIDAGRRGQRSSGIREHLNRQRGAMILAKAKTRARIFEKEKEVIAVRRGFWMRSEAFRAAPEPP